MHHHHWRIPLMHWHIKIFCNSIKSRVFRNKINQCTTNIAQGWLTIVSWNGSRQIVPQSYDTCITVMRIVYNNWSRILEGSRRYSRFSLPRLTHHSAHTSIDRSHFAFPFLLSRLRLCHDHGSITSCPSDRSLALSRQWFSAPCLKSQTRI